MPPETVDVAQPPAPVQSTPPAEPPKSSPQNERAKTRDSLEKAMKTVEAQETPPEASKPNQTEEAAAALRGQGKPDDEAAKARSEAAKKSWETRRANAEAAEKKAEKAKADARSEEDKGKPPAKAQEAPPKPKEAEAKPEAPTRTTDAPSRFSPQAKAEWDAAPEAVKTEVERALTELESGIEKHRDAATRYSELQPYEALARNYGMDLKGVLRDYAGMSQMIQQNPLQFFSIISQRHGLSFEQLAAQVLDRDLSEYAQTTSKQINDLSQENQRLKQQLAGYQQREQATVKSDVSAFADAHPRFNELSSVMTMFLQQGVAKTLPEAYEMAERLKPAAGSTPRQQPQQEANPAPTDMSAQTAKAELSISGAPTGGSNPTTKRGGSTVRDALKNAMARAS